MEKRQYSCDVCGAVKIDANRWWKIGLWYGGALARRSIKLELIPWDEEVDFEPEVTLHLCGQQCVIAKVDEFMGTEKPQGSQSSCAPEQPK